MPSPSTFEPFKRKKAPEKKESQEKDQRTQEEVTGENKKATEELTHSTQKNHEGVGEKGTWCAGSTTVQSTDGTTEATSTGAKYVKGDLEFTAGGMRFTDITPRGRNETIGGGVALNYTFEDFTDLNPFKKKKTK